MATYPGMSLGGEVRESVSLDEDDLSDVEDEVFIRDGKNSYKLAEELNVKRPLMPPRRKIGKSDLTSRLKSRPPCKAFCKSCCYIFAAISVLIGIIVLVVILVSIFPLPLDKLRNWVTFKAKTAKTPLKLLPCSNLKITDVWSTNLPTLTTDSPVRILDLDADGVDDVLFGFGTGDNSNILPAETFCPVFLGVSPPCDGGVTALNGSSGDVIWTYWSNSSIFSLQCASDLNGDGLQDCLASGDKGSFFALDPKNGTLIWQYNSENMDVLVANFVPDQNNDSVADVLASHTSLIRKNGHLVLISGKTGREIKRINFESEVETFFMPQLLSRNNSTYVVFGTGSPISPGNLSVVLLDKLANGSMSAGPIYEDTFKGILTQAVLVDITGNGIPDIVAALYNSTVVAIDGLTFKQIWNYTVPNGETNVMPTPGYFNDDNVTDFLIIYEKYDNILNYNYTETFIIDGKSGKPIYNKSISGSIATQQGGLTLRMESHGFDMFVFWTSECANVDDESKIKDTCRDLLNTTNVVKLNALNQYDQPPGFEIYSSVAKRGWGSGQTKSPLTQIRDYFAKHPKMLQVGSQLESSEQYAHKYGTSNFRHKDNRQGIVKDYMNNDNNNFGNSDDSEPKYDNYYDWHANQAETKNTLPGEDFDSYNLDELDNPNKFASKQMLYNQAPSKTNRDPRSKEQPDETNMRTNQSKKKNLSAPKYGIYDYQNIKMAKNRLLHDLNNLPWEILRDTYFKNRESQLRRSKFEQRDITSHKDKIRENEELKTIIDEERRTTENASYNLWDLESDKELQDRSGYWRSKREVNSTLNATQNITSVGAIVKSFNATGNAIDIIFITYWQPHNYGSGTPDSEFDQKISDCVEDKLTNNSEDQEQRSVYVNECMQEWESFKNEFPKLLDARNLRLGQMNVQRIKIECICAIENAGERCAKLLPQEEQSWSTYMGKLGDGVF